MKTSRTAASLLTALILSVSTAKAADTIRIEPFWLEPMLPPGAIPYRVPATFYLPANWADGDGAVIMLPDPGGPPTGGLLAALLAEGAAVLELDTAAARGLAADNALTIAATPPQELRPDLAIAIDQLQREVGPGLVVVIGAGTGGAAALEAMPETPDIAAAIALEPDGATVEARGSLPARVALSGLCHALVSQGQRAATACRAALLGDASHAAR
jgi:dienelactone hydrolase